MPYVLREVKAGPVTEYKKMMSYRVHTKKVPRSPNTSTTSEKQALINERVSEEKLRWVLNANFGYRDLHVVLHYSDKCKTLEQCIDDLERFLRRLRRVCKKLGITLKYIYVTETKRMTNIHHHIIISRMDTELIAEAWEQVVGNGGISFRLLDKRGNHYKLASYLVKESKSTAARCRELGIRRRRWSASRNLDKPKPSYRVIAASSWRKEPKAKKGTELYKFDNGASYRGGIHEETGYPYQEYFEVRLLQ